MKIRVTIAQRILMHYRVPVYERLADEETEVTVFYGQARSPLPSRGACMYRKFSSVPLRFSFGKKQYTMPWYPQAALQILREKPDILVLEGATNFANNLFLFPAAKLSGAKIVWWDAGRRAGSAPNILRMMADPVINFMMRHANACLAYSTLARTYMVSCGVGPERITVAYNTIDTEELDSRRDSNAQKAIRIRDDLRLAGKQVVIYAGVIERRKRVELLVDAFAVVRRENQLVELLIVGSGPHQEELERYAAQKGTPGVHFLGRHVDDLGAYLLSSDLFVLPSEGGLGIVEAMAHNLPVIVSSADGTELDLVQDGKNGFIVPENDVGALAEAMLKILGNPQTRREFGLEARKVIDQKFAVAHFVSTIASVLHAT